MQIFFLLILLIASGFFSASETALMSLSKIDARYLIEQEVKGAEKLDKLLSDPNKLLSAILVGNNLVNIGASSLATVIAIKLTGGAGVGIATGIMTFLILIFGEITPKSFATQHSQGIALKVTPIICFLVTVLSPIVKILMFITNGIIKLLGGDPSSTKPFITEDELKTIVTVSHEEGVLESEEKDMIYNVVDFGNTCAKDIMIPRTDMTSLSIDADYEEVRALYKCAPFSRIPIYEDTQDHIVGILHIKDLIINNANEQNFALSSFLRTPYFIHEFKRIDELLKEMREHKLGIAIVLDEYGGTAGLVTMEDLIEEIVGDIDDEYDTASSDFVKVSDSEYLVDGAFRLSDVNDKLNTNISSDEFDSIGGFVIGLFDRFPDNGEEILYENMTFYVEETEHNRINRLRILLNA